jgi:outer membrane protein assembly factor BamB
MASFEIILGATPRESDRSNPRLDTVDAELLDMVIDGERFSAASEPDQAACVLRDLVSAGIAVLEGRTAKSVVPLADAPWELCLVGAGATMLVSLFRAGPLPEVKLLDTPVAARDLAMQARVAFAAMRNRVSDAFAAELEALVDRLDAAAANPVPASARIPDTLVRWRTPASDRAIGLAFETVIAGAFGRDGETIVADLHALLFRGRLTFDVRGQRGEIAPGFVFLQLERLVSLCRPLMEAYSQRRALHLRVAAGASMLGLRLGTDGRLALSIARNGSATFTAPALDPRDFVLPVVDAALAMARHAVQCDRARARNLRLRTLRGEARAVRRFVANSSHVRSKVNDDPAPYRASAVRAAPSATGSTPPAFDLTSASRLRYAQRWRVEIEGIDLRGTLLCGDRMIVPGIRETFAIDKRTGTALWSRPLSRAATTLAGGDMLRLTSRGEVELRDVRDGEAIWQARIAPRVGAPALACTVSAAGMPRVVVLAEAEKRLVALDLRTGEPRWRHTARSGGMFRMRRVGRLLVIASGDTAITALDASNGEVVWRFVGPASFQLTPTVHRDTVLALAGSPGRGPARLFAIDAFTGAMRWSADHNGGPMSVVAGAHDVAAVAIGGRDGAHIVAHDLETGAIRFKAPLGTASVPGNMLALTAFDELLVANLPTGRVVGVDAQRGEVRWSRTLAAPVADDTPRRMDVQMRGGALYVPQSQLAVLRPRDGAVVTQVESCDLVPDLLQIDEDCTMFVGEESGHLGCYELGARFAVVRTLN